MLVVKTPTKDGKVRVVQATQVGASNKEVMLNPKYIRVLEYQCRVAAEEAVENALNNLDNPEHLNEKDFVTRAKFKFEGEN